MFDIEKIIAKSGDSELLNYSYQEDFLRLELDNSELDINVHLSIKTNSIVVNISTLDSPSDRTCYMRIQNLSDILETKNGYYIAPSDFSKLMEQKRNNLHLGYGEKEKPEKFIFQLIGSTILLSCIIESLDDIRVEES